MPSLDFWAEESSSNPQADQEERMPLDRVSPAYVHSYDFRVKWYGNPPNGTANLWLDNIREDGMWYFTTVEDVARLFDTHEFDDIINARALVNNPLFLLADEPTGNLDPSTSWDIIQLLKGINTRGTAVIMATHNHDLVKRANARVIEIRDGKLLEVKNF